MEAGADPNEGRLSDGRSPLSVAANKVSSRRSVATLRSLLHSGADPQEFCREGLLALYRAWCSAAGNMGNTQVLLAAGTPANALAPGIGFVASLYVAERSGHAEAVRELLSVEGVPVTQKEGRPG